ncbi:UNVERIFIED_CONTAM: hypothetical protein FKN15_057768 [Acipenser sinensis]
MQLPRIGWWRSSWWSIFWNAWLQDLVCGFRARNPKPETLDGAGPIGGTIQSNIINAHQAAWKPWYSSLKPASCPKEGEGTGGDTGICMVWHWELPAQEFGAGWGYPRASAVSDRGLTRPPYRRAPLMALVFRPPLEASRLEPGPLMCWTCQGSLAHIDRYCPAMEYDLIHPGAVLLASVQGISVNVDPIFYTWLLHQPQKGSSRHLQTAGVIPVTLPVTKKKEEELSVGSAPLAKQLSNQASEYASSPVKTKTLTESRPLSLPMKVINSASESCVSPEEKMKEFIALVWNAVKRLTLQLELQSCCIFFPNDSLPSPSTIVSGDIPGTVRSCYHNQARMPGTLVLCLPQIKVMSAGHKYMEPLQEIPFTISKPVLDEGDAFPWTISLSQFSVYTLLGQQKSFSLVEPMSCTSTLAVTSHKLQALGHESRHSFVVCLHVDLESLEIKCSNPQVQLLYELSHSISTTWSKIQKRGILRQPSSYPEPTMGAVPTSPVRSSVDTAPPGTSTCSPSADFGTPTECTTDIRVLTTIQTGYSLQFKHGPPPFQDVTTTSVTDPQDAAVVSQEAAALLQKWAIRMIDPLQLEEGFYSRTYVWSHGGRDAAALSPHAGIHEEADFPSDHLQCLNQRQTGALGPSTLKDQHSQLRPMPEVMFETGPQLLAAGFNSFCHPVLREPFGLLASVHHRHQGAYYHSDRLLAAVQARSSSLSGCDYNISHRPTGCCCGVSGGSSSAAKMGYLHDRPPPVGRRVLLQGDSLQTGDDSPFSDSATLEQKTTNIGGASGRVSLWMQWMLPKVTIKLFSPEQGTKGTEQKTTNIGGASGRVSLWMQWMLPKVTIKLFSPEQGTEICVVSELEDLSASVDVQDIYTKVKCKIGSFNVDHYKRSLEEGHRSPGHFGGVLLSCTDKLNRRTLLVRPISKQDPFSHFSGFFPPTAAKVLEVSHQQHGFLSVTYTKAVTKNVRHKLTSKHERGSQSLQKLSEGLVDSSPQFLHEILLTAQPFDVVLSCPLLAAVGNIFQAKLPKRHKDKGKSVGQPMRTHSLTSRSLPLIYINTSVIRVFFPNVEERQHHTESPLKKEDTLVLKLGSVSMAPQADNPLSRTALRKDIYQ